MLPRDLQQEEDDDLDHGPPDPNDDANLDHRSGTPARVDPLDLFQELQYLSSMSGPDISPATLVSDLPVPHEGDVEGMLVADAVQVCWHVTNV